jgi:hypothetical protein
MHYTNIQMHYLKVGPQLQETEALFVAQGIGVLLQK